MSSKLTRPQRRALEHMHYSNVTQLHRWPGGFWLTEPPPADVMVQAKRAGNYIAVLRRQQWIPTSCVLALEARGLLRRVGVYPEAWHDVRELTEVGREAAAEQVQL